MRPALRGAIALAFLACGGQVTLDIGPRSADASDDSQIPAERESDGGSGATGAIPGVGSPPGTGADENVVGDQEAVSDDVGFYSDDDLGTEVCAGNGDGGGYEEASRGDETGADIQVDAGPDEQDAAIPPSDANPCTDPVSFARDTMPAFRRGCTLSSVCHGQMNNSGEESLYLGLNAGGGSPDVQAVYTGLVGVLSREDPSMKLVTPGDTANSFLWHKIVGDQNTLAVDCAKATTQCIDCTSSEPCGTSMPYLGELVMSYSPADYCAITNWISQGAKNN